MSIKEKVKEVADKIKKEAEVVKGERSKDKFYSSTNNFATEEEAQQEFAKSQQRLFDVNGWTNIPGVANAKFTLYSSTGLPIDKVRPEIGNFIKIDLPGPVPGNWVEVVEINQEAHSASFTVKPAHDPTTKSDQQVTDHFFQEKARSIFKVERHGNEIAAMEIGLNEGINNEGEEAGGKAIVNTIVSETGWALFQKNQWKNLTAYLVGLS